jgi:hypothetical protein
MDDPIDFVTNTDIETLYAYGVACLTLVVCAWFAIRLTDTRKDRDFWHTQYEALNELRAAERDRRLGRGRARDARSVREARYHSQRRIAEEAAAGTFDQPTEALDQPDDLPAWVRDPCTQPARYPSTVEGLRAIADTTAETDMAALLREWQVTALSKEATA